MSYSYLLPLNFEDRPDRYQSDAKKDEDYDRRCARYYLSRNETSYINDFRTMYWVNKAFAEGNSWLREDVQTFLEDRSGNALNRIRLSQNVFRPIIEQHRSAILSMSVNATAEAMTSRAKTRREEALGRMKLLSRAANSHPFLKQAVSRNYPVGGDDHETEAIFDNYYQDCVIKAINDMMDIVFAHNRISDRLGDLMYDMDLGGLVCMLCTPHQNVLQWERIDPPDIIWDTASTLDDFSDSEFIAVAPSLSVSQIGERFSPPDEQMRAIEKLTNISSSNLTAPVARRKLPVHYTYWTDITYRERGWVKGDDGLPILATINDGDKPQYTDKDLVEPPEEPAVREIFGGKKKRRETVEVIRYCTMVPREYILAGNVGGETFGDWVLESGVYPLQEKDWFDTSVSKFPVKLQAWNNSGGKVLSPLTDAVTSQRMLNQVLVTFSGLLAQTGGAGAAIDQRAVSQNFPEEKIHTAIKNGETIILDTKGSGVPNAIGYYDNTPKAGLYNLLQVVPFLSGGIKDMTGSTDAVRGKQQGADQAVGVTQMMIDRGLTMQAPLLYAISQLILQVQQFTAEAGKLFYGFNPSKLEEIVGMDETMAILSTTDALLERVRVSVKMDSSRENLIQQGNAQIVTLLQMQQIDGLTASELWGRSNPEQVAQGWRKYQRLRTEAAKQEQFDQQRMMQMQMLMQQRQQAEDEERMIYDQTLQEASKERDREEKARAPFLRGAAAEMFPPPAPAGTPPSRSGQVQPMSAQPGLRA